MLHDGQCTFSHPGWLSTFQSPHTVYFAVRIRLLLSLDFLFAYSARPSLPSSVFLPPLLSFIVDVLVSRTFCHWFTGESIVKDGSCYVCKHSCYHSFTRYPVLSHSVIYISIALWKSILECFEGQVRWEFWFWGIVFRILFTENFNHERFIIVILAICRIFAIFPFSLAFYIVLENLENCMWEHYLTTVNVIFHNASPSTFCQKNLR